MWIGNWEDNCGLECDTNVEDPTRLAKTSATLPTGDPSSIEEPRMGCIDVDRVDNAAQVELMCQEKQPAVEIYFHCYW